MSTDQTLNHDSLHCPVTSGGKNKPWIVIAPIAERHRRLYTTDDYETKITGYELLYCVSLDQAINVRQSHGGIITRRYEMTVAPTPDL